MRPLAPLLADLHSHRSDPDLLRVVLNTTSWIEASLAVGLLAEEHSLMWMPEHQEDDFLNPEIVDLLVERTTLLGNVISLLEAMGIPFYPSSISRSRTGVRSTRRRSSTS